jgi:hypothetical protein
MEVAPPPTDRAALVAQRDRDDAKATEYLAKIAADLKAVDDAIAANEYARLLKQKQNLHAEFARASAAKDATHKKYDGSLYKAADLAFIDGRKDLLTRKWNETYSRQRSHMGFSNHAAVVKLGDAIRAEQIIWTGMPWSAAENLKVEWQATLDRINAVEKTVDMENLV